MASTDVIDDAMELEGLDPLVVAFIRGMRKVVRGIPDPPPNRWQNEGGTAAPDQLVLEDAVMSFDTQPRELGPDAWRRTVFQYAVIITVPAGTGIAHALSVANRVQDGFWHAARTGQLLIDTQEVDLGKVRIGTTTTQDGVVKVPVFIDGDWDHP